MKNDNRSKIIKKRISIIPVAILLLVLIGLSGILFANLYANSSQNQSASPEYGQEQQAHTQNSGDFQSAPSHVSEDAGFSAESDQIAEGETAYTADKGVSELPVLVRTGSDETIVCQSGTTCVSGEVLAKVSPSYTQEKLKNDLSNVSGVNIEEMSFTSKLQDGDALVVVKYTSDVSATPDVVSDAINSSGAQISAEPNVVYYLADTETGADAGSDVDTGADADTNVDTETGASANLDTGTGASAQTASDAESEVAESEDGLTVENSLSTTSINDPYAQNCWYLTSINAYDAWDYARANNSVTVATIDSGVSTTHSDLSSNLLLDYAKNTYTEESGRNSVEDLAGHGTHVAGIISALSNNGVGVSGVSWNANLLPIKATTNDNESLYTSDIVEGIEYIVNLKQTSTDTSLKNIRVLNLSLTGSDFSSAYNSAIQDATDAGILVVGALGNSRTNKKSYPAAYDNVLGVTALKQKSGTPGTFDSSYSNYGDCADIAAPGTSIYSTVRNNLYDFKTGTSMATPVVAGVAALIASLNTSLTPSQIENVIESTATDLGDSGWDRYYGYGAIDAKAAVLSVASDDPAPKVDTTKVYRLYNPATSEHLWTTSAHEYDVLAANHGWNKEGVAWKCPTSSSAGVYRLYNAALGTHHYTSDVGEATILTAYFGWQYDNEGAPIFYSASSGDIGAVSIYRLYNDGLSQHLYTMSNTERISLCANYGWVDEDIGFYCYSADY